MAVCKYCIAVKLGCPELRNCGGVTIDLIQKVITAVGGVNNIPCASFLSQLEVYDEDIGLVSKQNTQSHRSVLFPIVGLLSSPLILKIAQGRWCHKKFCSWFFLQLNFQCFRSSRMVILLEFFVGFQVLKCVCC